MTDANMSQEEIDALLGNVDFLQTGETQQKKSTVSKEVSLSPLERSNIEDEFLQGLSKSITGLQVMLNLNVDLSNPNSDIRTKNEILKDLQGNNVVFETKISGTLSSELFLLIPTKEAQKIVNVIMGGDGNDADNGPLDAAQIATIKDSLSVLIYSLVSHLSAKSGETITPIGMNVFNGSDFDNELSEDHYFRFQSNFSISGLVDCKLLVVVPFSFVKNLLNYLKKKSTKTTEVTTEEEEEEPAIPVKEVEFPSISTTTQGLASPNVELLLDVQMTVTVELGRTKKYIKDILEMGEGTIIELDKQAGEHVDVLVNGKLVARGEVVVIDENFGVRITEIISPKDKLGMKSKS